MPKQIPASYTRARRIRPNPGSGHSPKGRIRVVSGLAASMPSDVYGQRRALVPVELIWRFRNAQYVCAITNATAVASTHKRLYATTKQGENPPRAKCCRIDEVDRRRRERQLEANPYVMKRMAGVERVDEVTESPILETFAKPNPWIDAFQLVELSQLYREIEGRDFWYWTIGPGGRPMEIWPIPSWMVYVQPDFSGTDVVQEYIFTGGGGQAILDPSRLLFGRELNLIDPYTQSMSWLRANSELADIYDKQVDYRNATLTNRGRPDAMLVPREEGGEVTIDPDAIERIKLEYEQEFSKGGAGRLWVPPGGLDLKPVSWRPTDMGEIAMSKSVLHDMARAAGVPIPIIDGESANRANMDAALLIHARFTVRPKCWRLAEHWNSHFVPLWDQDEEGQPQERQFLAFDDPVAADKVMEREDSQAGVREGWLKVNEVRLGLGLPPDPDGDVLRVPAGYVPISFAVKDPLPPPGPMGAGADPKIKRDDPHVDGKKVPEGGAKPAFEEGDDTENGTGKKKAWEGENGHPFDVPSAHTILAVNLTRLGFLSRYLKGTLTATDRYKLLHAIRMEGRAWLRREAEEAYYEASQPAKALFGKARDRIEAFFGKARAYIGELLMAGALSLLGPGRLSDKEMAILAESRRFNLSKLGAFERDVLSYGITSSQELLAGNEFVFSVDRFAARAELYGGAPWPAAVNVARARAIDTDVFDEERRIHIGADPPCDVCDEQQALGWQPIGTLRAISDSPCGSNCHCHFVWREAGSATEYTLGQVPEFLPGMV